MKKIIWFVGIVLVIAVVIISGKGEKASTRPIKIGLSLPLTGDLAFIGEANRNAAQIAIEEIQNEQGLKHQYELVFEDDAFDAAKAASVMNKFITLDKVDAVISIGSTAGNVIAPLAEKAKIPHIGMASDPVVANGDYNFIHWTRPQEEAATMVQEMQKRAITKVAIIGVNQQGLQAITTDFKEKAKNANISVVEETFNSGQTDFRTIISKLQKENPQIYLLGAYDPDVVIIGKQIRNFGIKTPLTSIESFGLSADPSIFEGQWYVDGALATNEFDSKYRSKYGIAPGPAAPNTYDAIHLFVKAFENDSTNSAEKVIESLSNMSGYNGSLGPLSVNPDGTFISQASVKVIKDGKGVSAE